MPAAPAAGRVPSRNPGEIRRSALGKGSECLARFGGTQALRELLALRVQLRNQRLAIAHQLLGGDERTGRLAGQALRERKRLGIERVERQHPVGEAPFSAACAGTVSPSANIS